MDHLLEAEVKATENHIAHLQSIKFIWPCPILFSNLYDKHGEFIHTILFKDWPITILAGKNNVYYLLLFINV